ncbi:unnamed protein product, partial [Adineta ricciae]
SIPAPSLVQYSRAYSKYQETLTCPCTKITIGYSKFLQIDYKLHQVCSSVLVTQDWFNYLTAYRLTGQLYLYDYRSVINKIFQGLSTFCNLTTERLANDLGQFYSTQFISSSLISNQTFQIQVQSLIQQFLSQTIQDFLFSISLTRQTTHTNKLFTGLRTNANFSTTPELRLITTPTTYNNCSCDLSPKCTNPARIYDSQGNATLWTIPGFYIGCFVIESLLQSNLQCFFNQSCIDQLQVYLNITSTMNITQLNRSLLKNFQVNSTVEELVNNLMVEQWNSSILFDNYYSECQPVQCIYTDKMKNSAIYIVTTIIGLIGGLVAALKLVVPRLVIIMSKRKSAAQNEDHKSMKQKLMEWNLFPSLPPSTDEREIRNQRLATKCFVILLTLLLFVLLLYTSLIDKTVTIQVQKPTLTKYVQLYSKFSDQLSCPCKAISINYEKLFSLKYEFHQVCSSIFLTDQWFEYLSEYSASFFIDDFRLTDTSMFQSLNVLCGLISETISYRLTQFYSNQFISSSVISNQIFQIRIQSLIEEFISSTTNYFLLALSTIRSTTQSNGLLSSHLTNYHYVYNQSGFVNVTSIKWKDCDCIYSSTCSSQSAIYNYSNNATLWTVPGFYVSCYVMDSLLQSNLQCFFNQSCIDQLQVYLDISPTMNITQLNRSLLKNFQVNSTVEELVNNLMVEQWNSSISFDNYYSECQPVQCIYTDKMKNSAIYIVTTIIGLIGGLVTALKLIVPRVVMFFGKTRNNVERMKMTEHIRDNLKKSRDYFKNLNVFRSLSENENERHDEIISTRLFLFLLILSLAVLLLYTSLIDTTQIITIEKPTLTQYLQLYSDHSDALKCPCTKISVNYKQILSVEYQFHEICSSTFLNHDWIVHISQCDVQYPMYCNDFRCSGPYYFQTMLSYCQMVKKTISDSLTQFYSNQYISSSVIAYNVFESQVGEFIAQFISSTTNSFLLSISTIRGTTYSNGLLVGLLYNFMLEVDTTTNQ